MTAPGPALLGTVAPQLGRRHGVARLVDADLFNRAAVTSRSRIRDDHAVLGCVDLAHALQLDLDCHGWLLS